MDLTKDYPRSVKAKWQGIVQLGRAIDKGKAKIAGKLGEYNYDCPMDKGVFEFLGMDGEKLLEVIRSAKSDAEIEAYTRPFVAAKSAEEVARFNREWLSHGPSEESREYFLTLRNQVAPDRTDVTTWADVLDLDEKREVSRPAATATA
ncbi:MAG: DUF5069 domain-containing protein [Candidatus Eremiobacteraeota bacterium]|nr:DUF5069 domain-containing protein [Candidatus Eremiobacteraeota bacterium]